MLNTAERRAFLSAGLQRQNVTFAIDQYCAFRFSEEAGEWGMAMYVSAKKHNPEILLKALQKRFSEPLVYDGYYLCMSAEKQLMVWYPVKENIHEQTMEQVFELMAALVDLPLA